MSILAAASAKYKKNPKKINKNPNDLKLIFLELVHLGLYSGKVWENRFFLSCMTLVDPYSKLLLRRSYFVCLMKLFRTIQKTIIDNLLDPAKSRTYKRKSYFSLLPMRGEKILSATQNGSFQRHHKNKILGLR